MGWKRLKVVYFRNGWNLKKLKKALSNGRVRVRTIDVGRPKHHYLHVFYKGNKLIATTFGKFLKKSKRRKK